AAAHLGPAGPRVAMPPPRRRNVRSGDLDGRPGRPPTLEGRGVGSVVGRIDEHGCLGAVKTAGQWLAGQLDREWFVHPDGSLDGAQRPALIVAEDAAGRDIGGEVHSGSLSRDCPADPQGESDGGRLVRNPVVAPLTLAGEAEVVDTQGG